MSQIKVTTQTELDAVIKAGNIAVCVSGYFVLWGSSYAVLRGSSHAELRGSSYAVLRDSSHAELWGSSHSELRDSSHAELWDSSHAELWGSSHAELWGSSHAVLQDSSHAEAFGNVFIRLFSCLKIKAGRHVVIIDHGENKSKITGGIIIKAYKPKTALQWCLHWGVKAEKKIAILFKGVGEKYMSVKGGNYTPKTIPVALDWDGGKAECGGGLHFSPLPKMTRQFCAPVKYIACPVALEDIAVHPDGEYPEKVKARGCCAPVWEVNENGVKIEEQP